MRPSPFVLGSALALAVAAFVVACSSGSSHEPGANGPGGSDASLSRDTGSASDDAGSDDAGTDGGDDADDGSDDAAVCVDETPDACPDAEPSYMNDVQPILQMHCYECHFDAGIAESRSNVDLGSYEAVYGERGSVFSQLSFCKMPPSVYAVGLPPPIPPTPTERATVLGWLKCQAPDN